MPDSDIALAKKRLARELMILVIIQAVTWFIWWVIVYHSYPIPIAPEWDTIAALRAILVRSGMVIFIVAAFWGIGKIMRVAYQSILILIYLFGFFVLFFFVCLPVFGYLGEFFQFLLPCVIFPSYCIVPQFFISRWLAKTAEEIENANHTK